MKSNWQTTEDNRDSGVLSNPLSFLRSGFFYWLDSTLGVHGSQGLYWSLRSGTTELSNGLYFHGTHLDPQSFGPHGYGMAVRCVTNPSPLSLILAIL